MNLSSWFAFNAWWRILLLLTDWYVRFWAYRQSAGKRKSIFRPFSTQSIEELWVSKFWHKKQCDIGNGKQGPHKQWKDSDISCTPTQCKCRFFFIQLYCRQCDELSDAHQLMTGPTFLHEINNQYMNLTTTLLFMLDCLVVCSTLLSLFQVYIDEVFFVGFVN